MSTANVSAQEIIGYLASNASVELRPLTRYPQALAVEQRALILQQQLQADAAIFLERYGGFLNERMLAVFDENHLSGDYEVQFHLKQLRAALKPNPKQVHK
jgi:hypothetical protein